MSEWIGGYKCLTPMRTAGSGSARWCIASRGLERFFLKEFLSPVYPAKEGTELSRRQLERCELFEEQKRQGSATYQNTVRQCCQQIAMNMPYAERLQLLSFLSAISKADGRVTSDEIKAIRDCALWMQISEADLESVLNLGGGSLEEAYKVLGVSPDATDDEVRKAYRKLALQHHPDRVATLGEDIRRAAEQKLQKINEAKERIYKERGM